MLNKYKKIQIQDILEYVYKKETLALYGCEYFSTNEIANDLNTSIYQVRKLLKHLVKGEYCSLQKICTHYDEYDKWDQSYRIEMLFCKAYVFNIKRVEDFVKKTNRKFWLRVQNDYDTLLDEFEKELKN